jgi:hypothetical protein
MKTPENTYLGQQFNALESKEQWKFVLGLSPEQKAKVEISLDNDETYICFNDGEPDPYALDDDEPNQIEHRFKDYIGNAQGVNDLLEALGFNVQDV